MSPDMHRRVKRGRREIASYVGPRAFAPHTRAALEGLGYELVPACTEGRFDDASWRPALRLVDARLLDRIPDPEADPDTPIVVVRGAREGRIADRRIVGSVSRPIELSVLYPILQRVLEDTPRDAPRVATRLSARGIREDRRWVGNVVSLSEGGCFLMSSEPLAPGARMSLQFALPHNGILTTRAVCVHARTEGAGLEFAGASEAFRRHVGGFVTRRLAAL